MARQKPGRSARGPRRPKQPQHDPWFGPVRLYGGRRSLGRTPELEWMLKELRYPPRPGKPRRGKHLPAAAWKRLFLAALRRMASHGQGRLAQLMAAEALHIPLFPPAPWAQHDPPGRRFSRLRDIRQALQGIEHRRVSGRDLRPVSWPTYKHLHLAYKRALALFVENAPEKEFAAVWRTWANEGWLRGNDPKGALERARMESNPVQCALVYAAEAFGFEDAKSLAVTFSKQKLSTNPFIRNE